MHQQNKNPMAFWNHSNAMHSWRRPKKWNDLTVILDAYRKHFDGGAMFTSCLEIAVGASPLSPIWQTFTRQQLALAQGYAGTAATYIQSSQAFANEAQVRLAVDSSYYGWIEKQQAKLQQDYDRGLQILIGAGNASQE